LGQFVDCSVLLGEQLMKMRELLAQLPGCGDERVLKRIVRELCDRAALHVRAREQVIMPALLRAGWQGLSAETQGVHLRFKQALANLVVNQPGTGHFEVALRGFDQAVADLARDDEYAFIPALRAATDLSERRAMCRDIELMYQSFEPPVPQAGPEPEQAPVALVEEAALVLSSLAGMPAGNRVPPRH
jgi:hypothetical protein